MIAPLALLSPVGLAGVMVGVGLVVGSLLALALYRGGRG